ncbi:SDR family NAD(P)-dependent oxidoreductase [Enterococcus faecium]|uniref:SDR family NAD(P)-dependent oxidoreductase n=1 Tax=Enterococcus faecium TaxID=1352 RepID=UPI003CC605F9
MIKNIVKKLKSLFHTSKIVPAFIETSQDKSLEGRTALVSGGSSGIGFEISRAFLQAGAEVIICGRNPQKLKKSLQELEVFGNVRAIELDIADITAMENTVSELLKNDKIHIDILVNSAGTNSSEKFGSITEKMYDQVLNTNVKGILFLSQIIANYMKDNHIKGNILNITSTGSFRPADTAYRISKWGLRGLTLGMAKSLIKDDIVVNGIAPGPTATSMLSASNEDISWVRNPSGRMVTVEEVAELAKYMVSGKGRMLVGEIVCLSGGAGVLTFDDVDY